MSSSGRRRLLFGTCHECINYCENFFSFDAFSVLVLVLIVCMCLESGSHVIAMQNWDLQCMELSSSSH
jgi:hypothetical protein